MAKHEKQRDPDDRIGGYVMSAAAFAAITGLWAAVVRDDQFYAMREFFGLPLPATTVGYLATMPAIGYVVGRWPYEGTGGRGIGGVGKFGARALNFAYSHLLIVLFTVAMASKAFLNWDLDGAVQAIDDRLFDIASRFAPWLAAYLGGFNLGRAAGLSKWRRRNDAASDGGDMASFKADLEDAPRRRHQKELRAEPTFAASDNLSAERDPPQPEDGPSFFPPSVRKAAARRRGLRGGRTLDAETAQTTGAAPISTPDAEQDGSRGFFSGRRAEPDRELVARMRRGAPKGGASKRNAPKQGAAYPAPSLDRLR